MNSLLLILAAASVFECELADWLHSPVSAIRDSAEIVVDGVVLGFGEPGPRSFGTVQLEVARTWREQTPQTVQFQYEEECGPPLEIGSSYLVGVFRYEDGLWVLAALPAAEAAPLLAALVSVPVFPPRVQAPIQPLFLALAIAAALGVAWRLVFQRSKRLASRTSDIA